jgi:hypothetical protein
MTISHSCRTKRIQQGQPTYRRPLTSGKPDNRTYKVLLHISPLRLLLALPASFMVAATEGQFVTLRKYTKHLPWALPTMVFLFDFVDMQWMFSHEPGLSYEVVRRFQLLLLPGTFFFTPLPAILLNCGLAALVGTLLSLVSRLRS